MSKSLCHHCNKPRSDHVVIDETTYCAKPMGWSGPWPPGPGSLGRPDAATYRRYGRVGEFG